jgi:hypothetical protein
MDHYRVRFMPPKNPKVVLICSKCRAKGFLRKKHGKLHLPQKNNIDDFYGWLDYSSKSFFIKFIDTLFIEYEKKDDDIMPLKIYNNFFKFYRFPLKKIKEFEIDVVKSLKRKYDEKHFTIAYSNDLIKSHHLKKIISNVYTEKKLQENKQQNQVIFVSRIKLFGLFSAIAFKALKKCCEFYRLGIEKSYEKEMVEGLKSISYPMSINIDNRNELNYLPIVNLSKDDHKFDIKFDIPAKSRYRIRCKVCKITYPINRKLAWCDKCHNKIYTVKEKPSRTYIKNKTNEIKLNESKMNEFLIKFTRLMIIAKDEWFSDKEIRLYFQRLFDNISKEILEDLNMKGEAYFSIRHYDKKKLSPKKDCYISKESDFIDISIKLKEYVLLMRSLVKDEIYDIGKNNKKIYHEIIQLLRQLNFPERYIILKLYHDFDICKKDFHKEQTSRIF